MYLLRAIKVYDSFWPLKYFIFLVGFVLTVILKDVSFKSLKLRFTFVSVVKRTDGAIDFVFICVGVLVRIISIISSFVFLFNNQIIHFNLSFYFIKFVLQCSLTNVLMFKPFEYNLMILMMIFHFLVIPYSD